MGSEVDLHMRAVSAIEDGIKQELRRGDVISVRIARASEDVASLSTHWELEVRAREPMSGSSVKLTFRVTGLGSSFPYDAAIRQINLATVDQFSGNP